MFSIKRGVKPFSSYITSYCLFYLFFLLLSFSLFLFFFCSLSFYFSSLFQLHLFLSFLQSHHQSHLFPFNRIFSSISIFSSIIIFSFYCILFSIASFLQLHLFFNRIYHSIASFLQSHPISSIASYLFNRIFLSSITSLFQLHHSRVGSTF